jgi:hypothetical protein
MWIAWHNYIEDETIVCWKLVQKHGQFASSNPPKMNCLLQLTRIVGPIVRFSPNLLLVAKAEYLPEIYHRRAVKTNHYNLLGFGRTPSVFHPISHEDQAMRRRMVASAYNFSNVKGLEEIIDRRARQWIAQLKGRYEGGSDFDFLSLCNLLDSRYYWRSGF